MKKPVSIKIAYIGGGSKGWAAMLMNDLALTKDLNGEVALYDINMAAAKRNEKYGNWLQDRPGIHSRFRYRTASNLPDALKGADFVICSITPAPLSVMGYDLKLPQAAGITQTVGDTVGPGGILRTMRAIPIYEGFSRQVVRHAPGAWVINYTNPMTVLTRTLKKCEPRLKVFGCCHEVFGTQRFLANLAARKFNVPVPDRREIKVNVLGINHFTWITEAAWKGHDLLKLLKENIRAKGVRKRFTTRQVLAALKKAGGEPWAVNAHEVTYELFNHYGILPAAGDRHLAEFVPGFLSSLAETHRWGLAPTPIEFRLNIIRKRIRQHEANMKNPSYCPKSSGEEGVDQIKALLGIKTLLTNVNIPNEGQITNLPRYAVVETNASFSRDSVRPVPSGALPAGVLGLVLPHVLNQELLVLGALKRDLALCFQAFANDPLMTLPMDKAYELFCKMVRATNKYLPGYK